MGETPEAGETEQSVAFMKESTGAFRRILFGICAIGTVGAVAMLAMSSPLPEPVEIEKDIVIGGAFGKDARSPVIFVSRGEARPVRRSDSPALAAEPPAPAEVSSLGPIETPAPLTTVLAPRPAKSSATDAFMYLETVEPDALTVGAVSDAQPPANDLTLRDVEVQRGDTMIKALMRGGLDYAEAHTAAKAVADDFDPRKMQIGDVLTLGFREDDLADDTALLGVAIRHRGTAELAAQWSAEEEEAASFDAAIEAALAELRELEEFKPKGPPKKPGPVLISTEIDTSLYQSAIDAGLSPGQVSNLTHIFGFRVDFQRSIRKGDLMEVYFERAEDLHGAVLDGPILFARLVNQGRDLAYYRQPDKDGGGYFDAKGESNKRTLMLTPIDGARITSGFGKRRHPISGYTKMHRGIDFGAHTGTPIFAAGDGVIEEIGWKGGYGKYIRIRHNSVYKTAYAHMHAFRKGLKTGSRVTQGQTIGYVGSTGRSTGPHLHFEVFRQGAQVNPLRLGDFGAPRIDGGEFNRFKTEMARLENRMKGVRETAVAAATPEE